MDRNNQRSQSDNNEKRSGAVPRPRIRRSDDSADEPGRDFYDTPQERAYFHSPTQYDAHTGEVFRRVKGEWVLVANLKPPKDK